MRPGSLPTRPPVDTATAMCPSPSRATAPTVSAPSISSWRLRSVMKIDGSAISTPWSRAKREAPSAASSTCRPSSITATARSIGCRTSRRHATPPARSAAPSITPASSSTTPSLFRHAPMPGLMTRRPAVARSGSRRSVKRRSRPDRLSKPALRSGPRGVASTTTLLRRTMLAHALVECAQFLVDLALRLPPLQLVSRTEVDETRVTRQPRVDLGGAAEHLLGHPAVVRVALRGGPQLAQVVDLAQVDPEVPADVKRKRNDVLGEGPPEVPLQAAVSLGGSLDRPREVTGHVQLDKARG